MSEQIVIEQHPVSVCVPQNHTVTLSVQAVGTGSLSYQWFQSENEEVPGANWADLVVCAQKTQLYVCRINDQNYNSVFSEWVKVKVWNIETALPEAWRGEPYIALQPNSQTARRGKGVTLRCVAFGIPTPLCQWYRNGNLLRGETKETLQIAGVDREHKGSYLCAVSNVLEEKWTEPADVSIACPGDPPVKRLTATDKVALLIGNRNYAHHPSLKAPMMDVHELANLLQQLGFRVLSLLDLTRAEILASIDDFLELLHSGVYALFYYAGHGYECAGRNYLVATDAPQPYLPENTLSVQRLMHRMQERGTALNVVLLDTFRKWYKLQNMPSEIMSLAPSGNTVYGYATYEDTDAYEVQDGERSSWIFTKYLNKHVLRPEKVTHILEQVSEDLGQDPLVAGKQVVEIRHTLKDPRSLADPIRSAGHTGELRLRDLCWRQANELPKRRRLVFPCGVEVELGFSAVFSNIMVVFATVKIRSPQVVDCSVSLRRIPVMEGVFSDVGRPDEMDSLLLSSADKTDCSLRLGGLQKLQKSLEIEVDLHYTHVNSKLQQTETRRENVGRPLVARCDMYRRLPVNGATAQQGGEETTPFLSTNQATAYWPSPCQPPAHQSRPSTCKAENTWNCTARHLCPRSNEPEENDESELCYI